MELRHLKYFLTLASELHFRKAAEKLYISQPGLSKQIKELEEGLGFQLFERHNRKVALTTAGTYLQTEFEQVFKTLHKSIAHAELLDKGVVGKLSFGYVGSAMQKVIPDLLAHFKADQTEVIYNLKEMDNQSQINSLLANDLDIGFVRLERVPKGLKIKTILSETFCLVLPVNHPYDKNISQNLKQFKEEGFILFDSNYSPSYYEKVMLLFEDFGFTPRISHSTIHSTSIFNLVAQGFGISIVPKSLINKDFKGLEFIELSNSKHRTTLSAIWSKTNRNPILEKFLALI